MSIQNFVNIDQLVEMVGEVTEQHPLHDQLLRVLSPYIGNKINNRTLLSQYNEKIRLFYIISSIEIVTFKINNS
jgi:hypothetical protein